MNTEAVEAIKNELLEFNNQTVTEDLLNAIAIKIVDLITLTGDSDASRQMQNTFTPAFLMFTGILASDPTVQADIKANLTTFYDQINNVTVGKNMGLILIGLSGYLASLLSSSMASMASSEHSDENGIL